MALLKIKVKLRQDCNGSLQLSMILVNDNSHSILHTPLHDIKIK